MKKQIKVKYSKIVGMFLASLFINGKFITQFAGNTAKEAKDNLIKSLKDIIPERR